MQFWQTENTDRYWKPRDTDSTVPS